jgi:hypothetical protein
MKRLIALIVVISFVISSGMVSAAQPRRQRGCCSISRVFTGLVLGVAALNAYQLCTAPDDISKPALRGKVHHEHSVAAKPCSAFDWNIIGSPQAPAAISRMVECGQDIAQRNGFNDTLLHRAVFFNDAESVIALLSHCANPNIAGYAQQTPLHHAAICDNPTILLALIAAGANVNARDQYGETPIFYAIKAGKEGLHLSYLIDAGADLRVCNNMGQTAIGVARYNGREIAVKALYAAEYVVGDASSQQPEAD